MTSTAFPPTEGYLSQVMEFREGYRVPSWQYARENLVRIHIYHDDIRIEEINQEAAYDVASFIAEMGGIGDLFIGFSFFTMFQLVEIIIALVARSGYGQWLRWKERRQKNDDKLVVISNAGTNGGNHDGNHGDSFGNHGDATGV
eukprot:sb/3474014/